MARKTSPFNDGDRMLRLSEVSAWLGVAPNTIKSWVKDNQFPQPFILGPSSLSGGSVRWRKWEIDQWIEARPREKVLNETPEPEADGQ